MKLKQVVGVSKTKSVSNLGREKLATKRGAILWWTLGFCRLAVLPSGGS